MSRNAEFGPIVTSTDVDTMVIDTLKLWFPTYLAQLERERELDNGYFTRPRSESYDSVIDDDAFMDARMPAVFVTAVDTDATQRNVDSSYSAGWNVAVSAVVRGRTKAETRWLASMFEGCIRRIMLQQRPGGSEIFWDGTGIVAVSDPTNAGRYLAAGLSNYTLYTDQAVHGDVGPIIPSPDPYDDPDPVNDPDTPYEDLLTVAQVTTEVDGVTSIERS